MNTRKWIAYGATGVVGLGLFAGTATIAANAMDLRTTDGTVIQDGAINHSGKGLTSARIDTTGDSPAVSLVSAPTPTTVVSAPTADSPASAPSVATPASAPSPVTPPSPASAPSPVSAPTPASPPSPASPGSPASAASAGSD
ncbi:hypothetical protein [Microbacterium sp. No. 7]|uniref:hypothetical protein n=1 Tax=Microbacterium sp. No. 7 TaxID=1714373 RepID=UPI0006CF276F|nr:hypothetical protein [Microbacterium sp. No. 7]ALJ20873.1 hypothetical protein AOA12_13550 [Microbacterium sp. No. 7]